MPDLSRLSDAERRTLLLLAEGHTAKSAAALLETSEAAVNERLREARRKTGVGSSRELARRVAQENCDEKIGVAGRGDHAAVQRRVLNLRARWPVFLGVSALVILASVVGAFTALAVSGQAAPDPATPPRVVATYPKPGAVVPAGPLTLKVTFDRPMQPGWSFVQRDLASFPPCDFKQPSQSPDGRSFSLSCKLEPGHAYWIGFNSAYHKNFASTAGVPATPTGLPFSTK
jgi:DNA-binding CsgD family transcriptional regulator